MRVRTSLFPRRFPGLLFGVVFLTLAAACTEQQAKETVNDVSQLAARAAVESGATAALEGRGVALASGLACTSTGGVGQGQIEVSCTAATIDGEPVAVDATVEGRPAEGEPIRGSFVGTVGDRTIFDVDCLGSGC
jgi:hypothetical protein